MKWLAGWPVSREIDGWAPPRGRRRGVKWPPSRGGGRRGKLKPSERWCGIHPRAKDCLNNFNDLGYALTSIEFSYAHFTSTLNVIGVAFGRQIFRLEVMTQSPPPSKKSEPRPWWWSKGQSEI